MRGYIAAKSKVKGVDIHSQLRMIFIIATHQLNTYTTNPTPFNPISYTPVQTQSNPYNPYTYPYRSPTVLSFTHRPTPPPYFSQYYSPHHIPLYYPIYPQKHTPHSKDPYSQSEFLKLPIDKYLKIAYNKLIKGG